MYKIFIALILSSVLIACSDPAPKQISKVDTGNGTEITRPKTTDGQSKGIFTYNYQIRELNNALRIIIIPTDYPDVVALHIPVQTGSRNEIEEGKSGFAHFFEHMMFKGTEKYPMAKTGAIIKNAG